MISKNFHHVLRVIDRQPLVGPPESMREHVVAASKAMKSGDWAHCRDYLINEKMDAKVTVIKYCVINLCMLVNMLCKIDFSQLKLKIAPAS